MVVVVAVVVLVGLLDYFWVLLENIGYTQWLLL